MKKPSILTTACAALLCAQLSFASTAVAQAPLAAPGGDVVLTVKGGIENTNAADAAAFDLSMIEALEATEYKTKTIWTEGEQVFKGVLLSTLLDALGSDGSVISAIAANDYLVSIPIDDETFEGALVAYELNGKKMSRREKGPLWIVYPYDSDEKYRSETVYSRSIWQLDRITVK
ncbi:molybdopterin-dependent oxidoreductase [Neptunicoccus sediminis]|uniref:molybdopterin-dependent oxidoreductase n=1 Tax=Neptunicoccus sediminis TaxID=1892596 RepID=UPI0008460936|nr:molybdopterin-dependent oxidoreductase [Neptunicoccus sediminis]